MKTQIVFYILKTISTPKETALYACRIIEKVYSNGHKIYIYTSGQNETDSFDKQLWTFRDISFVPHEVYNANQETKSNILVGHIEPPNTQNDILVNLTAEIVSFHDKFSRVIEVIPNDDSLKAFGRKRFQEYKKLAYNPEVFEI